jgi:hypothetical protein
MKLLRSSAAGLALALLVGVARAKDEGDAVVPQKEPLDLPDSVVLADGRQIAGTIAQEQKEGRKLLGKYVVRPKGGGADVKVDNFDVIVAERAGKVELRGDDTDAYRLWRNASRSPFCDALEKAADECAKKGLVEDANRLLERLRAAGAAAKRLDKVAVQLVGKSPAVDEATAKRARGVETAASKALAAAYARGVDWCAKRQFPTAATGLLADLMDLAKAEPAAGPVDVEARAKALIPDGFPWKDQGDAAASWLRWGRNLLPSGARFLEAKDPAWERLTNEPWKSAKPLGFRSRNVLLFIMDQDPVVCGRALRLAEGTIRGVQVLLAEGEREDVGGDIDRLEVRIHKDRQSYLSEKSPSGMTAPEWSAGNFNPGDNISRFYVERGWARDGAAALGELGRVMTHEMTHHYLKVRWTGGVSGGLKKPGYWVVEGMATFVENQAVQMDKKGLAFDDESVSNLRQMAAIVRMKRDDYPFPMERFVDMSHADFISKLEEDPIKGLHGESDRSLWYKQAGALTYFLLHKKGPEGRARFVQYMKLYYIGNPPEHGWNDLGYEEGGPEQLDKEFTEFLAGVKG